MDLLGVPPTEGQGWQGDGDDTVNDRVFKWFLTHPAMTKVGDHGWLHGERGLPSNWLYGRDIHSDYYTDLEA